MTTLLNITESSLILPAELQTRDWYAWINSMPPVPPYSMHVTGEVLVGNPGIEAKLYPLHESPIISPFILFLNLVLIQRDGIWPDVMTWVPANYQRPHLPTKPNYKLVLIYHEGNIIAQMPVHEAQIV